jgi:hypothetical protein
VASEARHRFVFPRSGEDPVFSDIVSNPKAPSPLRSAGALQKTIALVERY